VSFGMVSVDTCLEAIRVPVLLEEATVAPMMQIPANADNRTFFITDQFLMFNKKESYDLGKGLVVPLRISAGTSVHPSECKNHAN